MGRYLLIEFDDNESADRLRAQIDSAEAAGKNFRVVGMYSKPSLLCSCPTRPPEGVKGAKFGWWLCPECRRPVSGWHQLLKNMLDDEGTPAKYLELLLPIRWFRKGDKVTTARSLKRGEWR